MNDAAEVKRLRTALSETQDGIARRLGVSLRTYSRWETGAVPPRATAVELMRLWAKATKPAKPSKRT